MIYHRSSRLLYAILHVSSLIGLVESFPFVTSFQSKLLLKPIAMSSNNQNEQDINKPCQDIDMNTHPSLLPGDPSLILTTNLDLGNKKTEVLKGKNARNNMFNDI